MKNNSNNRFHKTSNSPSITFLLFSVLFFFVAATKAQTGFAQQSYQTFKDIAYKNALTDSAVNLDIFLPDSNFGKRNPAVIIIHGGGWAKGDKTLETPYYMRRLKHELLSNSFAVISINYRLVSKNVHFPKPIEDCKDAVRWVRANANKYNIDTLNIGLWGGSAGGHLALLTAYTPNELFSGDKTLAPYSSKVNYVVDNFGPTDLNALFRMNMGGFSTFIVKLFFHKIYEIREKLVFAMTGYSVKTDKEKAEEVNSLYNPIHYINKDAVPTIIFHGTRDKVVPISQSTELKEKLDYYSIPNELITVKKGDHGFNNISTEEINKLVGKSISFIKEHLK